jgi:hypothetical protein
MPRPPLHALARLAARAGRWPGRLLTRFRGDGPRRTPGRAVALRLEALEGRDVPSATFAAPQEFVTSGDPYSVAAADLNGDGKPDLAVVNDLVNKVSVLLNTTPPGASTPTFAANQAFATGSRPAGVAAADFNGDGKADLAVTNQFDNTVSVLLNTTSGGALSFAPEQTFATGVFPVSVVAADLNGDGKADLAVANGGGNTVSVLLNTTSGALSFTQQRAFASGFGMNGVAAADLNGDGRLDLAMTSDTGCTVLLNMTPAGASAPAFAAQQTFAGGFFHDVVAADINGDGRPDFVAAESHSINGTVSVLLNTTDVYAAADFAGRGVWLYSQRANSWSRLTPTDASALAANAAGQVAAAFPGQGTWLYSGGAWTQLTPSAASLLGIDLAGDVVAEFRGAGVWRYAGGSWSRLTPTDASLLAVDAAGEVVADFPGQGVWLYKNGSWAQLTGGDASLLAISEGVVAGEFAGQGVWRYTAAGGWKLVTFADAGALAVDDAGDVAASEGDGTYLYTAADGGQTLVGGPASLLAMDTTGDLVGEFPAAGGGVWRYAAGAGWKRLTGSHASLLAIGA